MLQHPHPSPSMHVGRCACGLRASLGEINRAQQAGFSTSLTSQVLARSTDQATYSRKGPMAWSGRVRSLLPKVGDLLVSTERVPRRVLSNYNSRLHAAGYLMDGRTPGLSAILELSMKLCEAGIDRSSSFLDAA